MKNILLVGFIILSVVFMGSTNAMSQTNKYDFLVGIWDAEADGGGYNFVFTFTMEGDSLTGTMEGRSGENPMDEIDVEGNKVTFSVSIDTGTSTMTIDFTLDIDDDKLTGMLEMEYGSAEISGTKRKKGTVRELKDLF